MELFLVSIVAFFIIAATVQRQTIQNKPKSAQNYTRSGKSLRKLNVNRIPVNVNNKHVRTITIKAHTRKVSS